MACGAGAYAAAAVPGAGIEGLAGTWRLDQTFGGQLSGPVTVRLGRSPKAWLDGFDAQGTRDEYGWRFRFPGGRGELRVENSTGARIAAMWVQPTVVTGNTYATPSDLRGIAPGFWRGRVEPREDRAEMTMRIGPAAGRRAPAFLRDPLTNLGYQLGKLDVSLEGRSLSFRSQRRGTLAGTLDESGDAFALVYEGAGIPPLQFRRSREAETVATSDGPLPTGDGWKIGSPAEAGFSPDRLDELARTVRDRVPENAASPDVHSISIARGGKLVFDRYFDGFDEATPHDTRSAGKTYADLIAGIAIERGARLSDTTPIRSLFSRYEPLAADDPRKWRITLGNALSMSTGLDCDDDDEHSVANEDNEQSQTAQPDWYRLVLDARMVRDPGTKAVYCSASINLAGGAVAAATRSWLPLFFEENVAEPLQMQRYALNLMPTGQWYLGGGACVRPRDFLKIGQVFLDGGTWNGKRLISRDWIARSWKQRLLLGPGDGYGYAWHVRAYENRGKSYRAYEAQGNGGQILDVIPQLDLAVMIAQGSYNNFKTWGPERDRIVGSILDALR